MYLLKNRLFPVGSVRVPCRPWIGLQDGLSNAYAPFVAISGMYLARLRMIEHIGSYVAFYREETL